MRLMPFGRLRFEALTNPGIGSCRPQIRDPAEAGRDSADAPSLTLE